MDLSVLPTVSQALINYANRIPELPGYEYYSQARLMLEYAVDMYMPGFLPSVHTFVAQNGHPLARGLPLMNVLDVAMLCIGYVSLIAIFYVLTKLLGIKLRLRLFSLCHNLLLTCLSLFMMVEVLHQAFGVLKFPTIFGNGVTKSAAGEGLARIIWVFYASKVVEFVDTFIMIFKNNYRQVSFLHVYHHLSIFPIWWVVTTLAPGGDSYYSAALNSFIHVLMYSYYFFAALGVRLPFKKYLTLLQMTQFVTMFGQACYIWFIGGTDYPVLLAQILFFYMISLIALFANFFVNDRRREAGERAAARKKKTN